MNMWTPPAPPAPPAAPARSVWSARNHADAIETLTFSADRRLLASASRDGSGCLWDVGSSKPRVWSVFRKAGERFTALAFSPNRRMLAAAAASGHVSLFDVAEGTAREIRVLRGQGALGGLSFSPDGKLMAGGGDDATLRVWEPGATSGGDARILLPGHTAPIRSVVFSPTGQTIATAAKDCSARIWALGPIRPNLRMLLPQRCDVNHVGFTADGKTLATALQDGLILLWDATATKPTVLAELPGNPGGVRMVQIPPESETMTSVGVEPRVTTWSLRTRKALSTWDLPASQASGVALTADGRYLARGLADGTVELYRVAEKRT